MRTDWIRGLTAMAAVCGAVACGATAAWAEEPQRPLAGRIVIRAGEAEGAAEAVEVVEARAVGSSYWIGLSCRPVDPTLRAQLNLKEGLVVDHVAPESPAAKAGLAEHDIVVKVDGQQVGDLPALLKVIDAAKEKEVAVEYIRGGKTATVKVTPAKRPGGEFEFRALPLPRGPNWVPAVPGVPVPPPAGAKFQFFHPGVVLPEGAKFPKDLKVLITKDGENPAKIVVKQGDKSWEVTEKELDKLPAELRPHIERMLGKGDVLFGFGAAPAVAQPFQIELAPQAIPVPAPGAAPMARRVEIRRIEAQPVAPSEATKKLEARVEELHKKLDEILKRLEAKP